MLAAGTKLGPYEILAPLGAGGMGEVYRAHDSRLGRDVAVKVLPPHLAATPELRARFEREARAVSALSHPHVCALYDIGRAPGGHSPEAGGGSGDVLYLVMEHLEGETLAQRLERGPLPATELLARGREIADALDRAHRAGIVHRDLKPGNVMLTKGGAKLMDFGLARTAPPVVAGDDTESPTMSQPLTTEGTIVGTFQYMAPEVLEGGEADARSDIWSLGCVLYEMATGRKAFQGRSRASLISAILSTEPPAPATIAPLTPPALDRLILACLAKDPDERVQTAHDVKLELGWIAEGGSRAGVPAALAARRRARERLAWLMVGALAAAVVGLGSLVLRPAAPPRVVRFEVPLPRGTGEVPWPRISPDGRTLAYLAPDSTGTPRVWVRALDAVEARPLEGVEASARPFWSPDSRYLAFISQGKLRKVPVAGGPVATICDAPGGYDGTWGSGGWILFDGGPGDSIRGVPASGGTPRAVTTMDRTRGEVYHAWPFFLPDGRRFLFVANDTGGAGAIRLGRLGSKGSRLVGHTESRAEYGPPGWLVYVNGGRLMAQPLDARSAHATGEPVQLAEHLSGDVGSFSVSNAGVLAYQPLPSSGRSRLLWVGRDGRPLGEAAPPGAYEDLALSPDGARVALSVMGERPPNRDIWVRDLVRGVSSRLTFGPAIELSPTWSPDGGRIAFARVLSDGMRCYVVAASGGGAEDSLPRPAGSFDGPTDWSDAARAIVLSRLTPASQWDVWVLSADGRGTARALARAASNERSGRLSPDGRWLAYASDESGRDEVYVVPYPGPGGRWQVSTAGGRNPQWRADGKELFIEGVDEAILAADVRAGTSFELGVPKVLFQTTLAHGGYPGYRWAPSRDGQRFLVNSPATPTASGRIVVVTNWAADLGRR